MTDIATFVKQFRRDVPRPEREAILAQHQHLADVVAMVATVPEAARPSLYLNALWLLAAKFLEAPDATSAAERDGLLWQLSELYGMPYGAVVRDMREMVSRLDADHRRWQQRARRRAGVTPGGNRGAMGKDFLSVAIGTVRRPVLADRH
jgi:hypothetical protein